MFNSSVVLNIYESQKKSYSKENIQLQSNYVARKIFLSSTQVKTTLYLVTNKF